MVFCEHVSAQRVAHNILLLNIEQSCTEATQYLAVIYLLSVSYRHRVSVFRNIDLLNKHLILQRMVLLPNVRKSRVV